jgi:hypothetical protein
MPVATANGNSDPRWLSFLKSNNEAVSDLLAWLNVARENVTEDICTAVTKGDDIEAKLCSGERRALDKLRAVITLSEKELQDYAEYQRSLGTAINK